MLMNNPRNVKKIKIIVSELEHILKADLRFRKKYESGFEEAQLSEVLGDGVMTYSDFLEKLNDIENQLSRIYPESVREIKAKEGLEKMIADRRNIYTTYRNFFSAHPRTFIDE